GGEDETGVVGDEEPREELRSGQSEHLVQRQDEEQDDEAESQQVGVDDRELRELPFGEVVGLGELPIEQSGEDTDDHVGECRVEYLLHGSSSSPAASAVLTHRIEVRTQLSIDVRPHTSKAPVSAGRRGSAELA